MLRASKNAKKLSENDANISATIRSFSVKFVRFTNDLSLLQTPCCEKYHEACLKSISEDIISVRQHLDTCRAFTADSEVIAEILSEHIAYVEKLVDKVSILIREGEKASVEEQEQPRSPEEKVALRFGRLWEKGEHRRVYFDEKAVAKAVGFDLRRVRGTKRYFLEDDEYTNSAMTKLFQAFDGTYYDLTKNAFVSASSKNSLLDGFKAVFAREVYAAKKTAEPEVQEDRYYDPALHINAHEVKALFRKLYPHGKDSARLSIVDVTPGAADGEKYVICFTHLGSDPHFPDMLARVRENPLASSRMVWMGNEIASKYAIVFNRGMVEGLVEAWKADDPVRDSRAEEAERKERARARKEEQGA